MIKPSVKFHEYISYGLGVISSPGIFSITLHAFKAKGGGGGMVIPKLKQPEFSSLFTEALLMRIHNIHFYGKIRKIISKLSQILLNKSSCILLIF